MRSRSRSPENVILPAALRSAAAEAARMAEEAAAAAAAEEAAAAEAAAAEAAAAEEAALKEAEADIDADKADAAGEYAGRRAREEGGEE